MMILSHFKFADWRKRENRDCSTFAEVVKETLS